MTEALSDIYPSGIIEDNEHIALDQASQPEDEEYASAVIIGEPERKGYVYIPGSGSLPEDAVEVLRVWRDVNDGTLIVQVGSTLFQTMDEIRDRGMAKRFINVVKSLAQVATIGAQAAGLPKPNFEVTSDLFSTPGGWATQTAPTRNPVPTGTPPPPLVDSSASGLGIVAQIDQYLQTRLLQTPVFRGRVIRMSSAIDGSLQIYVDTQVYSSVGAITDREVREFIQHVLADWEKHH
jgi:hypothetical protein